MEYKTIETAEYRPRTTWINGKIPELPCTRNAERRAAVSNGSPVDPKEAVREWRESAWAVVRALTPFPEAKKAVIEALDAFNLGTPRAA